MGRGKRDAKARRKIVEDILRNALGRLWEIFKRRAPVMYEGHAEWRRPCHTCAFNPSTWQDKGWDSTVLGLAQALEQDKPFWCHDDLPRTPGEGWTFDAARARICMGWAAVAPDPEAKLAMLRASVTHPMSREVAWEIFTLTQGLRCRVPDRGTPVSVQIEQR